MKLIDYNNENSLEIEIKGDMKYVVKGNAEPLYSMVMSGKLDYLMEMKNKNSEFVVDINSDDNFKCYRVIYESLEKFADQLDLNVYRTKLEREAIDSFNIDGLGAKCDDNDRIYFPDSSNDDRYIIVDDEGNPIDPSSIRVYGISDGNGHYEPQAYPSEEAAKYDNNLWKEHLEYEANALIIKKMCILDGNMGEGWEDNKEAANGFAEWLLKEKGIESEIQFNTSGVGGGLIDGNGELMENDLSNKLFNEFCESEAAKKYFKIEITKSKSMGMDF